LRGDFDKDSTFQTTILPRFLTMFATNAGDKLVTDRLEYLRKTLSECTVFCFEICSVRIYEHASSGFQCQFEHYPQEFWANRMHEIKDKNTGQQELKLYVQTADDITADLRSIVKLVQEITKRSKSVTILFQTHFRPDIIHNETDKAIEKRTAIHEIVSKFVKQESATDSAAHDEPHETRDPDSSFYKHPKPKSVKLIYYDPSGWICEHPSIFYDGETHFKDEGHRMNWNKIRALLV
jgi:hypothetical protein